jgi:hypothetical protein
VSVVPGLGGVSLLQNDDRRPARQFAGQAFGFPSQVSNPRKDESAPPRRWGRQRNGWHFAFLTLALMCTVSVRANPASMACAYSRSGPTFRSLDISRADGTAEGRYVLQLADGTTATHSHLIRTCWALPKFESG